MGHITSASVTLPRAAWAAGFTVRGLRAVMAAPGRVPLLGQPNRATAKRHRVASVDVVRLAVARRLLDFGFTVAGAVHVLDRSVDNHVSGLVGCGVSLPPVFLLDRLDGLHLHVSLDGDMAAIRTTRAGYPRPDSAHDTTLTINLGAVAADALRRLASPQPPTSTTNSAGFPAKEAP